MKKEFSETSSSLLKERSVRRRNFGGNLPQLIPTKYPPPCIYRLKTVLHSSDIWAKVV